MSYLKLCQIANDYYIEDCENKILFETTFTYPATFACEVIEWETEENFHLRSKALSFTPFEIIISEKPENIRSYIHSKLLESYPQLVI